MSKPSNASIAKYHKKAYDTLGLLVPKGKREAVKAYAAAHGTTVNGLCNELLRKEMGLTEEEWKQREEE